MMTNGASGVVSIIHAVKPPILFNSFWFLVCLAFESRLLSVKAVPNENLTLNLSLFKRL